MWCDLNWFFFAHACQAEVYKADFDAERAAREKQHAEKETIFAEMQNLQLRNEQLIEELDNYSKKQVAEMQRRHSSMAPVRPLTGVPYGPGPGYVNVAGGQTDNIQLVNPQIFSRQQPFQVSYWHYQHHNLQFILRASTALVFSCHATKFSDLVT